MAGNAESNGTELETRAGFSPEQLAALRGLTVAVRPSAWHYWAEAMPGAPEVVQAKVARVEFDEAGEPVAFGIHLSEMIHLAEEHRDPELSRSRVLEAAAQPIIMFDIGGEKQPS